MGRKPKRWLLVAQDFEVGLDGVAVVVDDDGDGALGGAGVGDGGADACPPPVTRMTLFCRPRSMGAPYCMLPGEACRRFGWNTGILGFARMTDGVESDVSLWIRKERFSRGQS